MLCVIVVLLFECLEMVKCKIFCVLMCLSGVMCVMRCVELCEKMKDDGWCCGVDDGVVMCCVVIGDDGGDDDDVGCDYWIVCGMRV